MSTNNQNKPDEGGQYPGYPHYPAKEDITQPANHTDKLNVGGDGDVKTNGETALEDNTDDLGIVMGTEADVTAEDEMILGAMDRDIDMNEDEDQNTRGLDNTDEDGDPLNEESGDLSTMGADLDVPGSEQDDANEAIGEEDEENNYYSQSDNQEDTEGIP